MDEDKLWATASQTTEKSSVTLTRLSPYTRYTFHVTGCNEVAGHVLCSQHDVATDKFRTEVGTPGQANPPTGKFLNSTDTVLGWNTKFDLGAASVDTWLLKLISSDASGDVDKIFEVK